MHVIKVEFTNAADIKCEQLYTNFILKLDLISLENLVRVISA